MKKIKILISFSILIFLSCKNETKYSTEAFLTEKIPVDMPIEFKKNLTPQNKLIHKGMFAPNLKDYYYTISDKNFERFDVYVITKNNGIWSKPKKAFFNSRYSDHGMSFSPDGNTLYFSSTRPVDIDGVASTWHIWKSDKVDEKWNVPIFVDVPNLRNKLVSHPTITNSGTLYFHVSNLDYSEMDIYYSKQVNGTFENAKKAIISMDSSTQKCTPYVSPKGDYLIFASINNTLDLMITFDSGNGSWINTKKLNEKINNNGQGNPYVTPDNKFLFFTTGKHSEENWSVKWVDIASELPNN